MKFELEQIKEIIYIIRGQKVMLDSDLANLYGVETKVLKQAVKRNLKRFPEDFSFEPNSSELSELRSQIVTLGGISARKHITHTPRLFTESGIAMLSSVLKSDRAIEVNISIMRTFTKLRSFMAMENSSEPRVEELAKGTNKLFKIVFERLDAIDEQISPRLKISRKKIGFKK